MTTYCGVDDIPVAGLGKVVEEEEEGEDEESGEDGEDHQDPRVTHTAHSAQCLDSGNSGWPVSPLMVSDKLNKFFLSTASFSKKKLQSFGLNF